MLTIMLLVGDFFLLTVQWGEIFSENNWLMLFIIDRYTAGIQTYQILTNDDEVCIPSLSSILLAVTLAIKYRKIEIWRALQPFLSFSIITIFFVESWGVPAVPNFFMNRSCNLTMYYSCSGRTCPPVLANHSLEEKAEGLWFLVVVNKVFLLEILCRHIIWHLD